MSTLKASYITNPDNGGTSNVELEQSGNITVNGGINASGIVTANSFSGVSATFSGDVSIGGTLTYEDVTNIDSVGFITARTGINVLAGGIDAVGVVTATSFEGDGSNLTGIGIGTDGSVNTSGIITATSFFGDGSNLDGVETNSVSVVASGTIANGDTVVVNTDGTASVVAGSGTTASAGIQTVFDNNTYIQGYTDAIYDPSTQKVIVAYKDYSDSQRGEVIVGTIVGTAVTFGTPVRFDGTDTITGVSMAYDPDNQKVIVCYGAPGSDLYAKVVTITGTTPSVGNRSTVTTSTAGVGVRAISATYDTTNDKVVLGWGHYNGTLSRYYVYASVGTVSGTNITWTSSPGILAVDYTDVGAISDVATVYDSANDKVVIIYNNGSDGTKINAIVGTVSGTGASATITFGTPVTVNSIASSYISAIYDSNSGKVVITYTFGAGTTNFFAKAIVGTVSGTGASATITFGDEVTYASGRTQWTTAVYDSTNQKVVFVYNIDEGSAVLNAKAIAGTVSGTTINFDTAVGINTATSTNIAAAYDSTNQKILVAYRDETGGTAVRGSAAVVYTPATLTTNLTSENFIGIAAEAISDGATGKIDIIGGVNSGQSGLTTAQTYYVNPTGGIGLTASTPSVVAGTSISSTEVIVKG